WFFRLPQRWRDRGQPENHCSTPTRFKTPIPIQHKRKNTVCRQAVAAREPFQAAPCPASVEAA
ncbi:MAG: hypothetical protein ACFNLD_03395, partial [Kingella oralis]